MALLAYSILGLFTSVSAIQKITEITLFQNQVKFQVIGDWGSTQDKPNDFVHQKVVGKTMSNLADTDQTDFVIALGDNFYGSENPSDNGVSSTDDPKWTYDWQNVYSGDRMNSIPWYAILGNHDWYQNQTAQLDYANINNRWFMDDYFYSRNFTVAGKKVVILFISTDLIYYGYDGYADSGLYPHSSGTSKSNNMRNRFVALNWTNENDTINKQLSMIEQMLKDNVDADYLFVAGHEDMVTCGAPITNMLPLYNLFQKYKITAYLYGHAHQLAYKQDGPVLFVQSGAGGRSETCSKSGATWISNGIYGFANIKLNSTAGTVDFYKEDGKIVASTSFFSRSNTNSTANPSSSASPTNIPAYPFNRFAMLFCLCMAAIAF
ncbi:Tartrate-resistant acid phosphatase type 5 [Boothiomyces sp. JEL0838]|nr:Tartrate-resistant acid phosphatase type 5 [Boothiomyces sp. JEL0838]